MFHFFYYVGVIDENVAKLITQIDYDNRIVRWNENEGPVSVGKLEADKLARTLSENGYTSFVMKTGFRLASQLGG